jgi:hypothetical protein
MNDIFRLLPVCFLLGGCAADQAKNVPVGDLLCNEDEDCRVITTGFGEGGCYVVERPYAVSKKARQSRGCPLKIGLDCDHELRDWKAVCSDHVCKIRPDRLLGSPRRRCRE